MSSQSEMPGTVRGALLDARILRAEREVRSAERALDTTGKRAAELAMAAAELGSLRRERDDELLV